MCGWMEICFVTLVKYCDDHFAFLFFLEKRHFVVTEMVEVK